MRSAFRARTSRNNGSTLALGSWPSCSAALGDFGIGCAIASQHFQRDLDLGAAVLGHGRRVEGLERRRLVWGEVGEGEELLGVVGADAELLFGE